MKRALHIILLMLMFHKVKAQFTPLGADAYGQANSLVAVSSPAAVYYNMAGISDLKSSFLAVNYFKIMPVQGLQHIGAMGVYKNKVVNSGFSADSFGDSFYRESRVGLGFAKKVDKVSIGLKMTYLSTNIQDLSSRNAFLGEIGMMVNPSKFYSLGLNVLNFTQAKLYTSLPTYVIFGGAIYPNSKIQISSQLDYPLNNKPKLRLGMKYKLRQELALSSGVNPDLKTVHFGVDLNIKKYGFTYAVGTHPNVGMANHLTLLFRFNE